MTMLRKLVLTVAALLLTSAAAATAQDYPTKPVRVIVPFAPGGLNDIVARTVATHLSERLGKQFIVENRTGAGGIVGSELVANSPKDGYTLLIVSLAHAVNPWLYKLPYDPHKAFAPISLVVSSPNAFAVHPSLPAKNVKEFIALAKKEPGQIMYASGGVGGSLHLGFELFKLEAGIDVLHVPFRGAGPAVVDTVGGHTKAIIATVTTLAPHVKSGKLRALGISGTKRSPTMPDVPTFAEAGVSYEAGNWIGLAAPAGTPAAIIDKLNKEISAVQDMPDVQKRFGDEGADVIKMTPAQFGAYMDSEMTKWGRVIKEGNIKAE
jgi:tripartite-type tricarboxylate transporter receptor subunit TctC